ncbi:MAG: hypothetical protein Q9195_007176 [Heterodermia aff. obscurata]
MPRGTAETVRALQTPIPLDETGCSGFKTNLKAGQKRRPSREEAYESDDGFVANDGSDAEKGRSNKKQKKEAKGKRKMESNGKKEQHWDISDKRRVSVDEFRGNTMVNIREYYEKDGELLPTKKVYRKQGISLTVSQYNAFIAALPDIEKALADKGETVERPAYDGKPVVTYDGANEDGVDTKADVKDSKKNFEQTSEEED